MEYQVPQFIEVEDKIFGPLSLKQFIFVAGGVGLCVIILLYLPIFFGLLLCVPVGALTFALAFYKVNNKTFLEMMEAGFNFYSKDRLYLWKKDRKVEENAVVREAPKTPAREKLSLSSDKLKELAWSLDIKDQPNQTNP